MTLWVLFLTFPTCWNNLTTQKKIKINWNLEGVTFSWFPSLGGFQSDYYFHCFVVISCRLEKSVEGVDCQREDQQSSLKKKSVQNISFGGRLMSELINTFWRTWCEGRQMEKTTGTKMVENQEEKVNLKNKMVGWQHLHFNGHKFDKLHGVWWTGSLACKSMGLKEVGTEWKGLNWAFLRVLPQSIYSASFIP